ncbi:helix-turn-helix domain-containing protein [Klebsiella sp. BIGb0407]|uniref:helix-turn-helix domain-containing protein n=1 Tax=Klebsiella sp. BIGb0407 TaxID=2940603 RepID=UPI002169D20B|nr:XRE family transcriptional regulator [Klebsiella sp. BIGb0407]MCS3429693.1 transcriptional regulator with XRE-family HTH domain [Klebsiella sp. BIGb0407]
MDAAQYLATTLKNLRHDRGLSLSQAAEQTGVSKAMLGQIERNESSPTVATLWKIATGFNVPFSFFLAPSSSPVQPLYSPPLQDMQLEPLFPFNPELGFDYFSITLTAGALSESSAHDKGVVEHVVVISGILDLQLEGQWQTLQAGDRRQFAGDKAHSYRNSRTEDVHFHSLIHYPVSGR